MRSMTGFGTGGAEAPGARLTVEIRGVNQRHLDIKVAAPREYAPWEAEIRDRIRMRVARGRVDVTVMRVPLAAQRRYRVAVREELAAAYVEAARRLGRRLGLAGEVGIGEVLRLPELFEVSERAPEPKRELPALRRALGAAVRAFDAERRREGRHLRRDMQRRVRALVRLAGRLRTRLPQVERAVRRRVEERLARLGDGMGLDPARLAQELAALAERGDVTEELVRLDGHLAALEAALRAPGPVGKRIEFLLQEVLRELNTMGAKASDLATSALVLEAKGEVEKLREQIQNVE